MAFLFVRQVPDGVFIFYSGVSVQNLKILSLSEHRQPTKQPINSACLNIPGLPNT
jgi:hypothetical protein